ncbi:hypothetical protein D9615_003298 [Tricholomella constricta]|uniref:C-CAP/cofactor C-like domain-containing protein n=1 Tax=Tricholomella constricta TaxID=117010 RepID=A0A8H5HJ45_9AGAR|nr:hypothetical protein D9615_003298 [Tricholomella constricta]
MSCQTTRLLFHPDMSDLAWSFAQTFSTQFQTSRSDLESRVDLAKSSNSFSEASLQELSIELAKLTKSLAGATGYLPSYDQRQFEEQLKALEKSLSELRGNTRPRSKFAFKRKAAVPPSVASISPRGTRTAVVAPGLQAPTTHLSLSSRSYELLTLESLPRSSSQEDLAIYNLDHCIVDLLSPVQSDDAVQTSYPRLDISALHVRNLTDTVLLLPAIDGSVLIHDLTRCTIVIGCHQFRMHTSRNVDVYLTITSNPVIEHCSDIRFGGYPKILLDNRPSEQFSVMDFSHIRSTPSPNWSVLHEDRVTPLWPWPLTSQDEVLNGVRERILPE